VKTESLGEITIRIKLEPGEWITDDEQWSVASISFTVRKNARDEWSTRIDHKDFRAYPRRWTVKDRVAWSPTARYAGFFARRDMIPGNVTTELVQAYAEHMVRTPMALPPIDSGKWEDN
jgi:hypothetical protein